MSESITIERMTATCSDAFRALRLEALRLFPDFYGTDYADAVSATLSTYARRIETGLLLGAFDSTRLIGCLAFDREDGAKLRHRGWITSVYVQPGAQRQGVGARLLSSVLDRPEARGLKQLELYVSETNQTARRFYEGQGFHVVARSPRALHLDGRYIDELHMIRVLDA